MNLKNSFILIDSNEITPNGERIIASGVSLARWVFKAQSAKLDHPDWLMQVDCSAKERSDQ